MLAFPQDRRSPHRRIPPTTPDTPTLATPSAGSRWAGSRPECVGYARGRVHVNSAESYFSLLKREIVGTFHHISPTHLRRYVNEFDFRHDARESQDGGAHRARGMRFRGKEADAKGLRRMIRAGKENVSSSSDTRTKGMTSREGRV